MKQYIVIGAGRFGTSVAKTLLSAGQEVMIVDSDEDVVQQVSETMDNVAIVDASDENALRSIGLGNFDVAIVAIGTNLRSSIMATLIAKELGVKKVVSKASDKLQAEVLQKIGADRVVFPEHDMGEKLAKSLIFSRVFDFMALDDDHSIFTLTIPSHWVGKDIFSLNVRETYNVNIVGIKKGSEFQVPADPNTVFKKGDIIIAAGKTKAIECIAEML